MSYCSFNWVAVLIKSDIFVWGLQIWQIFPARLYHLVDCPLFNFLLITLYSRSDSHTSGSALISVQREAERMKEWKEEVQRRGGGKNKLHSPPNREPSLIMLFESSQKPSLLNRPVLGEPWVEGFLAVPSRARLPYFLSLIIFCLPLIIRGPPCS